jgi:hypothetical protein
VRQTPLSRLIDVQLGGTLAALVRNERSQGKDWRTISALIFERTGTRVSYESLRSWFADELSDTLGGAA